MDHSLLKTEIVNDPVGLGYSGKTDQQIADLLNSLTTGRTRTRSSLPTRDILHAVVETEYNALNQLERTRFQTLIDAGTLDPSNTNIRAHFSRLFAAGATRTALLALSTETISRATELGLPPVTANDVFKAKAQ